MSRSVAFEDRSARIRCDDFEDMFPGYHMVAREYKSSVAQRIRQVGRFKGVKLEVYRIRKRFYIYATNSKKFRWLFLESDHLDNRDVSQVNHVFYCNERPKMFFRALREKRFEAKRNGNRKAYEEAGYVGTQYQRVFRGLGRLFGVNDGKVKMPFGRPNKSRALRGLVGS